MAILFLLSLLAVSKFPTVIAVHMTPVYDQALAVELHKALKVAGFATVDDDSAAEATLNIGHEAMVVLDGGPEDYGTDTFLLRLACRGGDLLWQDTVRIVNSAPKYATEFYQAKRIVEKLVQARKRVASKGK